jgi:hypothetical protein
VSLRKLYGCSDKPARIAGPRWATGQRIAATGADRAVVAALTNEGSRVLEWTAVDANLKHAAIIAVLEGVIVAKHKTGVLKHRDHHTRRLEALIADERGIINPRSVWQCISRRRWQP